MTQKQFDQSNEAPAPTQPQPAFRRRALVSDIMTWHYQTPDRLATHLAHDRRFIPWMAARDLNAFFYIRHTVDSQLKIPKLTGLYAQHRIATEYGGHVIPLLLSRDQFAAHPEYFPQSGDHRNSHGNLCVSNPAALELVRDGAMRYLADNPECSFLHVWGADVWEGAWCRCGRCTPLSPQLQYMQVVNALAAALAAHRTPLEIAYLAYHDTIDPDPALQPLWNVSFEWAPRERCYSHAIDDPVCTVNPRYFASLKRYLDLFDGRAHIFEYYADAILFGGFALATPSVIMRDLRAYHALGIDSISCLTFGEHSWLAYPINLETYARGVQSLNFEPDRTLADIAAERHPRCAPEFAGAYRAIAQASSLILDGGGDLMRPQLDSPSRPARIRHLEAAHALLTRAIDAADSLASIADGSLRGERDIWRFTRDVLDGLTRLLIASNAAPDSAQGQAAIARIAAAFDSLRAAAPEYQNTWAAYDLEWITNIWIPGLRHRFDQVIKGPQS